jgi:23S rRNA pseudouridine955/2504/2580 synthase
MTPIEIFAHGSLMEVKLLTGRTHQIRVHAAYRGHPLAGDAKYGDKSFNRRMRNYGLRQLFLHAKSLCFKRPDSKRKLFVEAVLPNDLVEVLEHLRAEK